MDDFIIGRINEFNDHNTEKIAHLNDEGKDYAIFLLDRYDNNALGFALSAGENKLHSFDFHLIGENWRMTEEMYIDEPDNEEEEGFGLEKKLENDFDTIVSDWANYLRGHEEATKIGERINAVVSYTGGEDIEFVYRRFRKLLGEIDKAEGAFVNNSKLAEINKENLVYYYLSLINFIFCLDGGENTSLINEDMLELIGPYVKNMYRLIFEEFSNRDTMIDIGDLREITEVEIDDETAEFGFDCIYKKGNPFQLSELLEIKNNLKIKNEKVNKWIELWGAISGGNPDIITMIYSGLRDEDKKESKGRYLANGDNMLKLNTLEFIRSEMLDEKDAEFRVRMAKDIVSISMDSSSHYIPKSDIIDLVYDSLVDIDVETAVIFYEFTEVEPSNPKTRRKMYDYLENH